MKNPRLKYSRFWQKSQAAQNVNLVQKKSILLEDTQRLRVQRLKHTARRCKRLSGGLPPPARGDKPPLALCGGLAVLVLRVAVVGRSLLYACGDICRSALGGVPACSEQLLPCSGGSWWALPLCVLRAGIYHTIVARCRTHTDSGYSPPEASAPRSKATDAQSTSTAEQIAVNDHRANPEHRNTSFYGKIYQ